MSATPILAAAGFVVFGSASFFFALAETALFTLGNWQVRQLAERDPKRGLEVARLLRRPQDILASIVLLNTFVNAAIVILALWMVLRAGWPLGLTVGAVLLGILLLGEVIPKTLAVRDPSLWALRIVPGVRVIVRITAPFRLVAQALNGLVMRRLIPKSVRPHPAVTEADYAELLELGYQHGALGESEKEIILQIIRLDQRMAREVMQPLARITCLPDDTPKEEMIAAARRLKHRRLPLFDRTPDTIVGVLNTRALLLHPDADLSDVIEFASFVPETMNLLELLKSLQRLRRGVAIVLDEYGGTAGLVTMEDILGSMVGRIRGEGKPQGLVMKRLGPGRWQVSGTMRVDDFRREYPDLRESPDAETMAGVMLEAAEVVPRQGEQVRVGKLVLTAKLADERRVRELLVEVAA